MAQSKKEFPVGTIQITWKTWISPNPELDNLIYAWENLPEGMPLRESPAGGGGHHCVSFDETPDGKHDANALFAKLVSEGCPNLCHSKKNARTAYEITMAKVIKYTPRTKD